MNDHALAGTSSHKIGAAFLASLAVTAAAVFAAAPAHAQNSDCDAVVVDTARVTSETQLADVNRHATQLGEDHDAVVRVRIVDALPYGEPSQYLNDTLERCTSWTDGDGRRHPRLISVIVGPNDRATGLYYGGVFARLDNTEKTIQANVMNPKFAEGNFADGVTAGIAAIDDALAAPTTAPNGATSDPTGGLVLVGLLIFAAVAAAGVGIWYLARRMLANRARRTQLRERRDNLASRRTGVASELYNLNHELDELVSELVIAAPHPEDRNALDEHHQGIVERVADEITSVAAIHVPGNAELTEESLTVAADQVNAAEQRVAACAELATQLRAAIAELAAFADTAADMIAAAELRCTAAGDSIDTAAQHGFDVRSYRAELAEANTALVAARDAAEQDRRNATKDALETASAHLGRAVAAGELLGRYRDIEERYTQLGEELDELDKARTALAASVAELDRRYDTEAVAAYRNAVREYNTATDAALVAHRGLALERSTYTSADDATLETVAGHITTALARSATVRNAEDELDAELEQARALLDTADTLAGRVKQHRHRGTTSIPGFDEARTNVGRYSANPAAALAAATAARDAAQRAWDAAEKRRRDEEAEEARRRREEQRRRDEEDRRRRNNSSSFGGSSFGGGFGGGSSSSFGGGGSSSKW